MQQQISIDTFPRANHQMRTESTALIHTGSGLSHIQDVHQQMDIEYIRHIDPLAVSLSDSSQDLYFFLKRIVDVAITVLALILLAPIMVIIAFLIAIDSPGPVIFTQQRVGARRRSLNGQAYWQQTSFNFYKFRTMRADADQTLHKKFVEAYIAGDKNGMSEVQPDKDAKDEYKLSRDPRVTNIGAFLRKTSLDELPQLWNVITGDMGLVGPRPAIPYEVDRYKPWHLQRFATLSGITGLWQVSGRSRMAFDDMVKLDIEYSETQNLWLDIKILLWTIPAAFLGKGAG